MVGVVADRWRAADNATNTCRVLAASVLDVSCSLLWPAFLTTAVLAIHARAAILVAALIQVGMQC